MVDSESGTQRGRGRGVLVLSVGGVTSLVALLIFGVVTRAEDRSINDALSKGSPIAAPGFELEVLESDAAPPHEIEAALGDGRLALAELAGTPVVLNLWASWCIPCEEEAPVLEQAWGRWQDRGVLFLGLDMQDLSGEAQAFVSEFGITYPNVRDPGKSTASEYGATGIPETFFIDEEGRVVAHVTGVVSSQQLDDGARAAIEGRVLGAVTGGDFSPQR